MNCGFCEAVCPTFQVTFNSSIGARGRVEIAKYLVASPTSELRLTIFNSFYSCLNCSACLSVCPVGINAGRVSSLARKQIVSNGMKGGIAEAIVSVTSRYGSPLAISPNMDRILKGTKSLEDSDTLLYTGQMYSLAACSSSFSKMEKILGAKLSDLAGRFIAMFPVTMKLISVAMRGRDRKLYEDSVRAISALLSKSGVPFKFMEKEPYPGTFLLDLGYEDEFREYASGIASAFKSMGIRRIITADPHTYNLLKYDYPKYVDNFDFEILFYTDLLKSQNLERTGETVVFHEPCHIARGNEPLSSPLAILRGAYRVLLPQRSGSMTACCGGPDELMFPSMGEKISEVRYEELRSMGEYKIVTACPVCLSNLRKDKMVTDLSLVLNVSGSSRGP
ncbi:MAG: (Fe-S)-binding protein [Thermoplasmata archaeon]